LTFEVIAVSSIAAAVPVLLAASEEL